MLRSLESSLRPHFSDICDMANAVLDGTDGLVLSNTTAYGEHPVEAIACMHRACMYAEAAMWQPSVWHDVLQRWRHQRLDAVTTLVWAAVRQAWNVQADVMVVVTAKGRTAQLVSRWRPSCAVVAVVRTLRVARGLRAFWGVKPVVFDVAEWTECDDRMRFDYGLDWCRQEGLCTLREDGGGWGRAVLVNELKGGPLIAVQVVDIGDRKSSESSGKYSTKKLSSVVRSSK